VAILICKLPIRDKSTNVLVKDRFIKVPAYGILIWVGIDKKGRQTPDPATPRVPALLDTGFNGNFAIREEQLVEFAGIDPRYFTKRRDDQNDRGAAEIRAANIWLYPNRAKTTDPQENGTPVLLELDEGITVFRRFEREQGEQQARDVRPRLPLLGMRGLRRNNLSLLLDLSRSWISIWTPRRYWLFG
jgi:hypothetical protein